MANKKTVRSRSRTQQRYARKKAVETSARPISNIGGGQGGLLSPSATAGGFWG